MKVPNNDPFTPGGSAKANAKLTKKQVIQIRKLHEKGGVTILELAKKFGVKRRAIEKIIRHETWRFI